MSLVPHGGIPTRPGRSIRFITHSPPSPGISGDRIRVFHLMQELKSRGWSVRLWSLVSKGEPAGSTDAIRAIADELVLVPRETTPLRRFTHLAMNTVTRRAFHAQWFWSRATARAADAWLADSDEPIFVEQLYMYPFIPIFLRSRIILDTQNHETARMKGIARSEGGLGRRFVARLQVGAVHRYEQDALRAVACILAVSAVEADVFEEIAPGRVRIVPNGVDVSAIVAMAAPPPSRQLLFLGSLSYSANRDAIRYFAQGIASMLIDSGATLTIVGSGPQRAVSTLAARAPLPITLAGYVPDIARHFLSSRAMIVPLRHGAGTRLKILEALARGLPVVTTSIGAEGLDLVSGTHALIADEPVEFAASIERLFRDDELWMRLSRAGRELVEERYDWRRIGFAFNEAAQDVGEQIQSGGL